MSHSRGTLKDKFERTWEKAIVNYFEIEKRGLKKNTGTTTYRIIGVKAEIQT
jgi:hypothetical protein